MTTNIAPRWLTWAREIQALAQTGKHYTEDDFQIQRFERFSEIAAEIIQEHSNLDGDGLLAAFNQQLGYATPKVDVRAAIFRRGKLLMVRERIDDAWTLPGGWADVGDVPSQAAEREVWEESGFEVKAQKLIGVYDANRVGELALFHAFKLIFLCDIIGGQARPSNETSAVAFFSQGEIPARFSGERTKPHHITDAFAAFADPECPTVFD